MTSLDKFGFKFGRNGPHSSRTMMLDEVSTCLDLLPRDTDKEGYREAIVVHNILGKQTESTRKESFRRLREIYGMDPSISIFRLYRELDQMDVSARPLLSVLTACARDPLLRATIPVIIASREGQHITAENFEDAIERALPGYQKPKIRAATARHISSTWTQSGHLEGRSPKIRIPACPSPAALTMALIMGFLEGHRNAALFGCSWCRVLDLNTAQTQSLALQAHREGYLDLRMTGNIAEITFPRYVKMMNNEGQHEPL